MILQFHSPKKTISNQSLRKKLHLDKQISNISEIGMCEISCTHYDALQLESMHCDMVQLETYSLYLFPKKNTCSIKELNKLLFVVNEKIAFGEMDSFKVNKHIESHLRIGYFIKKFISPTRITGELDIRIFPSKAWAEEAYIKPTYFSKIHLDEINKFGLLMPQLKCIK